ncbi:hypothetical protein CP557_17295 [Natrinema ejinorense]|uniref:Uncharacterized protein n=1 Tax=Natrinema ejinorense TaxID=373386 RepID=A0A2A5QZ72_9EURY|nr:hypothetical protein CP557_17295 [Natrinema ejinorense]
MTPRAAVFRQRERSGLGPGGDPVRSPVPMGTGTSDRPFTRSERNAADGLGEACTDGGTAGRRTEHAHRDGCHAPIAHRYQHDFEKESRSVTDRTKRRSHIPNAYASTERDFGP